MSSTFILRVFRGEPEAQYWEEFELALEPFLNITSALMKIQERPVNRQGKRVTPVAWEQGCLEEVCGSCSMLINGRPRQACTALIDTLLCASGSSTVILAPFTKFPLVKDLVVDRDAMFDSLKRVRAWIDVDDSNDQGFGPKISQAVQEERYILSTCMTCGCCSEACPQVNNNSEFIGPAPVSQVRLFNSHPVGALQEGERLDTLMEKGGVSDCGKAFNCVQVCPKEIPLTESLALMGRKTAIRALKKVFSSADA